MTVKARLIQAIGTRAALRVYWGKDCPNCLGGGKQGCHNGQIHLGTSDKMHDQEKWGRVSDYQASAFPSKCDHCSAFLPQEWPKEGFQKVSHEQYDTSVHYQVFTTTNYNTDSGKPEIGDMYYIDWYPCSDGGKCMYWDNCDGKHLYAICPGEYPWDIMSRESNCTLPNDRLHRCWVPHGTPPNLTVGKSGLTCAAGAGSIATPNWHGFLTNGFFVG